MGSSPSSPCPDPQVHLGLGEGLDLADALVDMLHQLRLIILRNCGRFDRHPDLDRRVEGRAERVTRRSLVQS
jgi:hypothetical protein